MTKYKKGFTLIETLLVITLIGILLVMIPMLNKNLYNKVLLKTTANEVKSALHLAQQMSIDESTSYCVEILNDKIRVRRHIVGGKVVWEQQLKGNIKKSSESHDRISYNADGVTNYGEFVFVNSNKEKIKIQVAIGTGKVKITQKNRNKEIEEIRWIKEVQP